MKKTLSTKAFTLIELLIVIAIIAILAAAVIIAVNPGEQLAKARDATRERHINALESAVYTYQLDNATFPSNLSESVGGEICNTNKETPDCEGLINLSSLVEEGYLPQIPINPTTKKNTSNTGYNIATIEDKVAVWSTESETRQIGSRVALEFDGENDVVQIPHNESFSFNNEDSFTLSAWVYVTDGDARAKIIHKGSMTESYGISFHYTDFEMGARTDEGYYSARTSIIFDEWVYLTLVADSEVFYGYINGSLFEQDDFFGISSFANTNNWGIGKTSGIAGGPINLDWKQDDTRIYNRALSESEIQSLYKGQNITEGLIGHWPLSEGQGCTVYDHSGNNNHGTLEPNCPEEGPGWVIGR